MARIQDFEILDERFKECIRTSARLDRLFDGCRWAEGPAYSPAGRYLVWSDIPNDRMMRWDETTGVVGVFRQPAELLERPYLRSAGAPRRRASRDTRRVARTEHDGTRDGRRRTLRRQAPQQPQRRRRTSRTARSGSPIPPTGSTSRLRGRSGRERNRRLPRLPRRSAVRRLSTSLPMISFVQTAWRSHPMSSGSTSADSGGTSAKDGPRHIRKFRVDRR